MDNNFVETIISLAPNLFYGTTISVNILVLSKHKTDTKTQFIDASGEDFFKKVINNNELTDTHINRIMELFDSKADVEFVAKTVDNAKITENDYNLSVSEYVKQNKNRQQINISNLNTDVSNTIKTINSLRDLS